MGINSSSMRSDPAPGSSRDQDTMTAGFYTGAVSEWHRKGQRNALQPSAITTLLALLAGHHPLSTFDIEVNALVRVAALHVADGHLWVAFLNEMPHECLISDRTPLRPRKRFQGLKVPGGSKRMQLEVPKPGSSSSLISQGATRGDPVSYLLSGTLKSDLSLSARLDMPLRRHFLIVSSTLSPKNSILSVVSFSSDCWNASKRPYSSIIFKARHCYHHATPGRSKL